tara:strand:+ start:247 stop:1479 length:1233 start_codon:yes stop_codon:yes gene_type:complete
MQRIILLDELGEKFGIVHKYYNLRTPSDAIKLLCINYPLFKEELLDSEKNGIGYKVIQSETEFEIEDMLLPFGSKDLIIAPVISGSGSGTRILTGIALIGLAVAGGVGFAGGVFAAGKGAGTVASAMAIGGNVGIALTLGGIAQMLSPQPEISTSTGSRESSIGTGPGSIVRGSDGTQSYSYRGAVNSVGVGSTIPVVFGKAMIGSHIISADIEIADESDPLNRWIRRPSPTTMQVNGEKLQGAFKETSGVKSKTWSGVIPTRGVDYLTSSGPKEISLTDTSRQSIADIIVEMPGHSTYPSDKFQAAFELRTGLFTYIAGEDSTKIDGYITYKLITVNAGIVYTEKQVTVQGIMSGSQKYKWVNWFTVGKRAHQDEYTFFVQVVDYSANLDINSFYISQCGYNNFLYQTI